LIFKRFYSSFFYLPIIVLLLIGCASANRITTSESVKAPSNKSINWYGVLIAGAYTENENEIDNWDNAMTGILDILINADFPIENIRLHSSKPDRIGQKQRGIVIEPAWKFRISNSVKNLNLDEGDGLFLFISSHGVDDRGILLESEEKNRNLLSPGELDTILNPFENIPIIVFISSCYSGDFLACEDNIIGNNRLIFTASAADRSSFGCGGGSFMPEWDESLIKVLNSVDEDESWENVINRIEDEIELKEANLAEEKKSLPQSFLPNSLNMGFMEFLQRISRNRN
jgi:hypothetical protein